MPRRVQAIAGVAGLLLPEGRAMDGGDIIVVSDAEWDLIRVDAETLGHLDDLGYTTDPPDPVPTFRDIQRAASGGSTGLEAKIDAVNADFLDHEADTTGIHGIADTALLETQAGAQSKADQAETDAKQHTDLHASQTLTVHGIADTAKLDWNQSVDVAGAPDGSVLTKSAGLWVGVTPTAPDPTSYRHTQSVAAAEWTVTHNLGRYPAVVLRLASNPAEPVYTDLDYVDANTVRVLWPAPETGWADV